VSDDWEEEATSATDLSEIREQLSSVGAGNAKPCLTVITGAHTGALFKVVKGAAVIGRSHNVEIKVEDDGISRAHARIRATTDKTWVEDLGSRNGTYVNGEKIAAPRQLSEGDKIQVGRGTVLRFGYHDDLDESFHENLMSSALRDGLTKLFNKRYFLERLDAELKFALRHDAPLSLLMLDLDHFKRINDTFGHLFGDTVLSTVATTLSRAARNEDVVARFGGEEFAVLLRAIPVDGALQMADRLRRLIEATPIKTDGQEIHATVSVGVAGYPALQARTPDELLEAADKALYRAKGGGRNRVGR
jgi:two-component system, cell cycle response regulator